MCEHIPSTSRSVRVPRAGSVHGGESPGSDKRGSRLAVRVGLGIGLALGVALICSAAEAPREVDGLVRVSDQRVDHLYVLPEADFANFSRVHLEPAEVSFSERWSPNPVRSRGALRLNARDVENIRSTVASEFQKTVASELMKSGYTLVDEDGEGVLRVTPMIVNLYVAAPSKVISGRTAVYVANTGHMTLIATARDSVTGELLARVVDTQRGRNTGRLQLATRGGNLADARRAFALWATVLRDGLDDARKYPISNAPEKEAAEPSEATPR